MENFFIPLLENADKVGAVLILAYLILFVTPKMNRYRIEKSLEAKRLELEAGAQRSADEAKRAYKMASLLVYHKTGAALPPGDDDDS